MNKIIREHYPVANLPADLRVGVDPSARVTVTIMVEENPPEHPPTLDEIWASRRPPHRTKQEIDTDLRHQRDEWDD
jgi:hypothetical protein